MATVDLVVTVLPGRPTCTLQLTNTDVVPHTVSVVRSRGVAGDVRVRWLTDVVLAAAQVVVATDDEGVIGLPYTYDLFIDGAFIESIGSYTSAGYADAYADVYAGTTIGDTVINHQGPWFVDGLPTHSWLRHLTYPSLSRPVLIESWPTSTREGNYGELTPLGAGLPVVTYYPRAGRAGTVTFITLGVNTANGIDSLVSDGSILQLATDPAFGVRGDGVYMAVTDAAEERPTDDGISPERSWPLGFVEVDAPPALGGQGGLTTYLDLSAAYVTYGALRNAAFTNGWTYKTLLDGGFL